MGWAAADDALDFDDFIVWITLGIILGGRIGYVLFYNPAYFAAHPFEALELWKGGMSFHGGFIGCVAAVVLFALKRGLPILSLGDVTCAVGTIGLFLGRLANFINGELWGRPSDVPWAMVFPSGGPLPRHPSQLYEAALEGLVLCAVLALLIRAGALKRPGLMIGAFAIGYAIARSFCELFREPDPQLGFLWGGLTMGMVLSVPLLLFGVAMIWNAMRRPPLNACKPRDHSARSGDPAHHRDRRADFSRRLHAALPRPSASRLLCDARSARNARRFHHRAGSQPDVRRADRRVGRGGLAADGFATRGAADRARTGARHPDGGRPARHAEALPDLAAALSVHLVETSPVLRAAQESKLAGANCPVSWHAQVEEVPEGPCIAIANEFVDALPVDQLIKDRDGWHMRMVGLADDRLAFVVSPDALPGRGEIEAPAGAILELRRDQPVAVLAQRVVQRGGAALVIDYGHATTGFGDTLQAVRGHAFADPLADPGLSDLTTQVDFAALARTARREGAQAHGPVTQGDFLRRLGIEQRATRLKQNATAHQAADIDLALARLTAPDQMGDLFKVLAIARSQARRAARI